LRSVKFIFGIHNHQPVGNFDFVFEHAYSNSYLPFIELLEEYPSITMSIHFSGCLLEWMEDAHPEFLDRVASLVSRGNLEILSSGFYEPILAVIPDHDKIQQITKLNQYIKDRFNYEAEGAWLTERVWEPHLPKILKESGIKYVAVDDFHFLSGGKTLEELDGYYLTDEQGFEVGVFPISQRLRYAIPFADPEKTIEILKDYATPEGDRVVVMADDGEKFGVWPGTHDLCFKKKWLKRFFDALVENSDWIKMTTFKDYVKNTGPRGRTYLPTVSYFEMNEWTLPAKSGSMLDTFIHDLESQKSLEKYRPFISGGTWRNFQSLYEESNWMQKRMVDLSWRVNAAEKEGSLSGKKLKLIQEDLWRSQCNCAYWHGIFGGIYLPHLRHAIYTHLLKAETALNEINNSISPLTDFDKDGGKEGAVRSRGLQVIASQRGGVIRELDLLDHNFNLTNSMGRYSEAYHSKLAMAGKDTGGTSIHDKIMVKEPGLEKYLITDTYNRTSFIDHFIPEGAARKDLEKLTFDTAVFAESFFDMAVNENSVSLKNKGTALGQSITIEKNVYVHEQTLEVSVTIVNNGVERLSGYYGNEWNFSLLGGDTPDRYYEINGEKPARAVLKSKGSHENVSRIGLVNEWDKFRTGLSFDKPVKLWRFPIYTVSMSEAGFEKVYQSSVVVPLFKLDLGPGGSTTFNITFFLEPLS